MEDFGALHIEIIENGPFMENCYLAADGASGQAIVIDPGSEAERIQQRIEDLELSVVAIVHTHAHIDHMGAAAPLQQALKVPCYLHPGDLPIAQQLPAQAALFGLPPLEVPTIDSELADNQHLKVGDLSYEVLCTPGHTPGGCCLFFREQGVVFVGDTLFSGSIGRTDLPGGNHDTLLTSLQTRLLTLDDATVAFSGHGPPTTIGAERRTNPFLS